jgi:hypothetical protein
MLFFYENKIFIACMFGFNNKFIKILSESKNSKLKNPTLVFFSKKNMFCYLLFQYLKQIRP